MQKKRWSTKAGPVVGSPFKARRDVPVYRATGPVWGSLTAPLVSPIPPPIPTPPVLKINNQIQRIMF